MESIKEESNMVEFEFLSNIPKKFTGICKVKNVGVIYHMKDGKLHNETEPSVIYDDGSKSWYINDLAHRENGPAVEYADGGKGWYYKSFFYGRNNDFTNETWAVKVSELKAKNIIELRELSAGVI